MPFVKAAVSAIVGMLAGLVLGYVLWAVPTAGLVSALARTTAELDKTKAWLFDEIHRSDAKHTQLSTRLSQALAQLAQARAELARSPGSAQKAGSVSLGARHTVDLGETVRPTPRPPAPDSSRLSDPARR
jgi:hypothetical protein